MPEKMLRESRSFTFGSALNRLCLQRSIRPDSSARCYYNPLTKRKAVSSTGILLGHPLTRSKSSLGVIDTQTITKASKVVSDEEKRRRALMAARPSLDEILNLHDFEVCHMIPIVNEIPLLLTHNVMYLGRCAKGPSG